MSLDYSFQSSSNRDQNPILIVGAGWAGLSAAVTLVSQGKKVMLLEASNTPGGRARNVSFANEMLDNGQHLLLGGYKEVLSILKILNIEEQQVFKREPFNLLIHRKTLDIHLKSYFFRGLLSKGLSIKERLALFYFFSKLRDLSPTSMEDLSIQTLLKYLKQPDSLIRSLWNPLALAALSTDPSFASASIFVNVLQKTFTSNRSNSDLLFPLVSLGDVLPNPACAYLKQKRNPILFRERVTTLLFENNRCVGVKTNHGSFLGSAVILATPPYATARILECVPGLESLKNALISFQYHPITTIYLQFKSDEFLQFKSRIIGFTDGVTQWMFDLSKLRKESTRSPILSIVITGEGAHSHWDPSLLVKKVVSEIRDYYPLLPDPIQSQVITEKRAAFSCQPAILKQRSITQTQVPNLFLAGDHLDTGFPATLEAAVQTGINAATLLL